MSDLFAPMSFFLEKEKKKKKERMGGDERDIVDEIFEAIPFRPSCKPVGTILLAIMIVLVAPVVIAGLTKDKNDAGALLFALWVTILGSNIVFLVYTSERRKKFTLAVASWIKANRKETPSVNDIKPKKKITYADAFRHVKQECNWYKRVVISFVGSVVYLVLYFGFFSPAWLFYSAIMIGTCLNGLYTVLSDMRMCSRKTVVDAIEKINGYEKSHKQKCTTVDGRPYVIYVKD